MKNFKCTVTRETTMNITIDDSVYTDEEIKEWSKHFQDANGLEELVERIAAMKVNHEDGEFLEGFGIPLIDGKKPYPYLKDNEIDESINICNQEEFIDVDVAEITY